MSKIMVVGSLIVDVAAYTPHFPVVGETALGTKLKLAPAERETTRQPPPPVQAERCLWFPNRQGFSSENNARPL